MTDLRTAAQQALDWLYDNDVVHPTKVSEDLRAALAQPAPESETCCTWHQDGDSDSGVYATSCGRYFDLTDGTPEDNQMRWCCYCGKQLAQELIAEETK